MAAARSNAAFEGGLAVRIDVVDQADRERASGVDVTTGVHHLGQVARSDDRRQALQSSDIRNEAHRGLTYAERRIRRGHPDVACRDQIDPRSQAVAVDGSDDRFGRVGQSGESGLQLA